MNRAEDEMVEGYLDGRDPGNPEPNTNRSRHTGMASRAGAMIWRRSLARHTSNAATMPSASLRTTNRTERFVEPDIKPVPVCPDCASINMRIGYYVVGSKKYLTENCCLNCGWSNTLILRDVNKE